MYQKGNSSLKFPILCHYYQIEGSGKIQFLFSVSKKKFPKSVDRNRIKRVMREAVRLQKNRLIEVENQDLIIGFTYVGNSKNEVAFIFDAMSTIFIKLNSSK